MPERRKTSRPDSPDRRSFPRPPLWLNIAILILAIAGLGLAKVHRGNLDQRFSEEIAREGAGPTDLQRMRAELAELELTREGLEQELNSRLEYVENQKASEFYLAIDTTAQKLLFHYGPSIAREAPVTIGQAASFKGKDGKEWNFVPLKGAFLVRAKEEDGAWEVPSWAWAMTGQPEPAAPVSIENGLGRYVIYLPNGYVIHSPPSAESPLKSAKPGSFMVPEEDLRAMWPRISEKTRVFIF